MSTEYKPANSNESSGYERRDVSAAGIFYFLLGLAVAGVLAHLLVAGVYAYLEKRSAAEQTPVNPLVTNAPADTRRVSKDYPQSAFPDPKLEEDERSQLNGIRLKEERTLSAYDYIDQKAGTVRIPIERHSQRGFLSWHALL